MKELTTEELLEIREKFFELEKEINVVLKEQDKPTIDLSKFEELIIELENRSDI